MTLSRVLEIERSLVGQRRATRRGLGRVRRLLAAKKPLQRRQAHELLEALWQRHLEAETLRREVGAEVARRDRQKPAFSAVRRGARILVFAAVAGCAGGPPAETPDGPVLGRRGPAPALDAGVPGADLSPAAEVRIADTLSAAEVRIVDVLPGSSEAAAADARPATLEAGSDARRDGVPCSPACYLGCGVGCNATGVCLQCDSCTCDSQTLVCHC